MLRWIIRYPCFGQPTVAKRLYSHHEQPEPVRKTIVARALSLFGVLAALVLITSISIKAFTDTPFTGNTLYADIFLAVAT